ncbi:hypothetical protein PGH12_06915 [Chryseobacterium wangxinyae]|uniref:hypothetical protein n=1 Tax=Chryseobacterium sp. CY350 TaxID=2997336 RepID=UPI00226E259E|nr:hypothetical protein [Chryseobacterium sp. CY350]MCY0976882.1 hypothetical protein [Chryseobacterium sp. CY350]WBZ96881.1 hypothetical protein PGH12_06915 [Chryseobacterium sp. CY350]
MKLKAIIREDIKTTDQWIIVDFVGDVKKQQFKVLCLFSPFYMEMKKSDLWLLNIKIESEIQIDPQSGRKSYYTHLLCKKAELIQSPYHDNY